MADRRQALQNTERIFYFTRAFRIVTMYFCCCFRMNFVRKEIVENWKRKKAIELFLQEFEF